MKFLLLFVILLHCLSVKAQELIKGNEYKLKGRIIDTLNLPTAGCGYFAFAAVIEFKIIKFSDSSYSKKYIPIIFPCPEFYGKNFFKVGNVYDVDIADTNQANFGWTLVNKKALIKYNIKKEFWGVKAKKIDVSQLLYNYHNIYN